MARTNALALTTRDFELLDARHLAAMLRKHATVLKECGLKDSDLRDFDAIIEAAAKHNKVAQIESQTMLDQTRLDVRQRLGEFRRWSEVVARPPAGIDAAAWKTLKLNIEFPSNDVEMIAFFKGLEAAMRKYSAKLAARSFTREKQEGLVAAYASFQKLSKEVVAEKSSRKSVSGDRNSSFTQLRSYVRHYRQLGLAAFHGVAAESDFRRLAKARKPAEKKKPPEDGAGTGPADDAEKAQSEAEQPQ